MPPGRVSDANVPAARCSEQFGVEFTPVLLPGRTAASRFLSWSGGPTVDEVLASGLASDRYGLVRDGVVEQLPSDAGPDLDFARCAPDAGDVLDISALQAQVDAAGVPAVALQVPLDAGPIAVLAVTGTRLVEVPQDTVAALVQIAESVPAGSAVPAVVVGRNLVRASGREGVVPSPRKLNVFRRVLPPKAPQYGW